MGNKSSKSVLEHSKINREIVDCIEKMQSINLFAKDILIQNLIKKEFKPVRIVTATNEKNALLTFLSEK